MLEAEFLFIDDGCQAISIATLSSGVIISGLLKSIGASDAINGPSASNWLISLVPGEKRGRYMAIREGAMIATTVVVSIVIGSVIDLMALWSFGLQIGDPYFAIYFYSVLGLEYAYIMLMSMIISMTRISAALIWVPCPCAACSFFSWCLVC